MKSAHRFSPSALLFLFALFGLLFPLFAFSLRASSSWHFNLPSIPHQSPTPPVVATSTPAGGNTPPPTSGGSTSTSSPPAGSGGAPSGTVFRVGPDEKGPNAYASPMALWSSGKLTNGATVDIDACTYTNDFNPDNGTGSVNIAASNVYITAVATTSAHCVKPDPWNGANPNHPVVALIKQTTSGTLQKGLWNIDAPGVTVDHIAFEGADSGDMNGAGLRIETDGTTTIQNSYFFHNQDGILGGSAGSNVVVSDSEFYDNGTGGCVSSCTHQLYINNGASLSIAGSYFHDIDVSGEHAGSGIGNQIKSRARSTTISGVRVFDNSTAASYEIDLPQSGTIKITGSVIEQGANTGNPVMVDTGENGNDGALNSSSGISISGNTFINDYQGSPIAIFNGSPTKASITDNQWYGLAGSQLTSGSASLSGNTVLASRPALDTSSPVK